MQFSYKDNYYDVEIIRKNNKNTYIRVRGGKIIVTTSYFVTKKSIEKLILDNRVSIEKMIDKEVKKIDKEGEFFFLGEKYLVIFQDDIKDVLFDKNIIYCKDSKSLNKYLNNYMIDLFSKHLEYWYNMFEEDIPIPNLKIRKMKSRWGVCNVKNFNITLNSELLRYDIECLDYVIVHELSHFLVQNHSSNFWKVVGKYYPNYKEIRKKLRS